MHIPQTFNILSMVSQLTEKNKNTGTFVTGSSRTFSFRETLKQHKGKKVIFRLSVPQFGKLNSSWDISSSHQEKVQDCIISCYHPSAMWCDSLWSRTPTRLSMLFFYQESSRQNLAELNCRCRSSYISNPLPLHHTNPFCSSKLLEIIQLQVEICFLLEQGRHA